MMEIQVTKIEAARRQIDEAIRLLFENRDPVAVHTLTMASQRIIRDLCEETGAGGLWQAFKDVIKPGMEKEFWAESNRFGNFFKHADWDPHETSDTFTEEINDCMLFTTCMFYKELGHSLTNPMKVLGAWYMFNHPKILRNTTIRKYAAFVSADTDFVIASREDQLNVCLGSLQLLESM